MIDVDQLSKTYDGQPVVDRVSFSAPSGRITGFLGANGAGKSTTIHMILGLTDPSGGRATIDGLPYRSLPRPMRQVGAVLDDVYAYPSMTAVQQLSLIASVNDLSTSGIPEVLDLVGLSDMRHRPVKQLSLGMGRRLAIAAALLGGPRWLVSNGCFRLTLDDRGWLGCRRLPLGGPGRDYSAG